jgi:hypothetical protein
MKTGIERLQGVWNVVSLEMDGQAMAAAALGAGEWSMISGTLDSQPLDRSFVSAGRRMVEASGMTVFFGPRVYSKAKFTVDRSKSPLCFAAPGRERPGDFASTPGDGRTFTVWIKVRK